MAPLRWAALRALLPLMVVSRWAVPGPRTLLPILVVLSQSSDMLSVYGGVDCWLSLSADIVGAVGVYRYEVSR